MAGATRHLQLRNGRYYARLVVPQTLRKAIGKTELRTPLGPDRRTAMKQLPAAVAAFQSQIARAEREVSAEGARPIQQGRYPLTPGQIANQHYMRRLAFDEECRQDHRYASIGFVDEFYVEDLRKAIAGGMSDAELQTMLGKYVEHYHRLGNHTGVYGTNEWRDVARALAVGELEALARVAERDEGDFTGKPEHPLMANALPPEEPPEPVSLSGLWEDYVKARTLAGFMKDGGKRARPVIVNLRKFLRHDDARRVTRKDLLAWRDHLMLTLSAKTVNDIYLSTVRTLWKWAHENELLPENVAATVKQPKPKRVYSRERGYTDIEAISVLKASRTYSPKPDINGKIREHVTTTAAKKWAPIICAFSGARVSEILQLRKQDVRQEGDLWIIRITPDAGTIKSGGYRDVPLHKQIIQEGFLDYLEGAAPGPLFNSSTDPRKAARAAARQSERLAAWLHELDLVPDGLQPNYAWRHRFKTQTRELGLPERVADAIQGHAGKTASDNYGDVTLSAKARVIDQLPDYDFTGTNVIAA